MLTSFRTFARVVGSLCLLAAVTTTTVAPVQAQDDEDRIIIDEPNGSPISVIRQLRSADVIPNGGKIGFQYSSSFAEARREGYNTLRLGRGIAFEDAVYSFQVRGAELETDGSGCGFIVNDSEDSTVLALLTNERVIYVAQFRGDDDPLVEFNESIDDLDGIDAEDYDLDSRTVHTVTLVINDEDLWLFLNGVEITHETEADSESGQFGITIYNAEGNTNVNECRYSNIWVWNLNA